MDGKAIERFAKNARTDHQRTLIWVVHDVILTNLTHYKVTTKWNVPFYTYLKDLCYLNYYEDHIYVSYLQGQELSDHPNLEKRGSKTVAKYYVKNEKEVTDSSFLLILLEAVALQEDRYMK